MKDCAFNPFLPLDVYIPDGEPHVFDGRVYLFGSHDREGGSTFCELDYEFFSAPVDDLRSWNSKGINYSARQDALFTAERPYMYAPDVVRGNDMRDNDAYVNKVLLQSEDLNAVIEKVKTFDFVDTDNIFCSAAPWAALRSQPAPQRTAKI